MTDAKPGLPDTSTCMDTIDHNASTGVDSVDRDLAYLVVDLETTGLAQDRDRILEIAAIGLTPGLDKLFAQSWTIACTDPQVHEHLRTNVHMQMHRDNGLAAEINSGWGVTLAEAETKLIRLVDEHKVAPKITLAGSGVANFDLPWIRQDMPALASRLTYFCIDVGPMRRLYKAVNGRDLTEVNKLKTHRAMDDARCHLSELRDFAHVFAQHDGRMNA